MTPTERTSPGRLSADFTPVSLLALAAAFALLWNLGAGDLAAWDEAIYAEVSKEAARGGDWLTLHWGYRPWFEKPPLFMWVTAFFYSLFGVGEFWARAPSALSGVALVLLTYFIGGRVYGRRAGILASVVLLTCYHFISFSRFGTTDVMLTLFTYSAVYGHLRADGGSTKWWYLVWPSCAAAVMVKGAGGLVAPAAIVAALAFDGRLGDAIRSSDFRRGVAAALLITVPWHALMCVRHGRAFLDEYVGYHVVARATRTLEGHPSGYFYYVGKLIDGFFPWCLLVPFAVVSFVRRRRKDKDPARSRVLLVLAALVFVPYTLIPTRRPWYIIPVYPALAVLVAGFVNALYQTQRTRAVRRRLLTAACAVFIAVGGLYSFVSLRLGRSPEEPVAKLSRLARVTSPDDKDPLLLLYGVEPVYAQVPLFYSDRPVRQVYASPTRPAGEDAERYVNYENLSEVVRASEGRIILRREDVEGLSADYDVRVLAEEGSLALALLKRR
jgi:4-amino-4-deoxy-L-arabinose transferase-like glycosyltransferase